MEINSSDFTVVLKSLRKTDAESLADNANDYEIAHNVARPGEFPFPYTKEDALSFIRSSEKKLAEKSEYHFGIFLDGRASGACGLMHVDRLSMKAEIGFWLGKRHWGEGNGWEAVQLLLNFGFKSLGLNRIYASTPEFNQHSARLLKSCKFVEEGKLRDDTIWGDKGFVDQLLFGLLKRDFKENKNTHVVGYR